jgi:glycosyltransferase involved in cell wall biosynthesis
MLEGARVFVVVPAYNEERLIAKTLAGMPELVDRVIVVDDASTDRTALLACSSGGDRTRVERHATNRGVGAALSTGYRLAIAAGADVIAVMAGDGQMHADDLAQLALPVIRGQVDYAKGDRLSHPDVADLMPWGRRIAGQVLSWLTRRAANLPALSDSQCGYTVISARAAERIDLDALFPRYGYPNDLLGQLSLAGLRIRDLPVRPVYGEEKSGIRPWHVAVILWLIARVAWRRLSTRRTLESFSLGLQPRPRARAGVSETSD